MTAIYLLLLHFIADFILQSREMGKQKSSSVSYLLAHLSILFAVILIGTIPALGLKSALILTIVNTIVHGIIDWNIWRGYKLIIYRKINKKLTRLNTHLTAEQIHEATIDCGKEWKYWEDHLFYTTIGLDQFLHAATLLIILNYLK